MFHDLPNGLNSNVILFADDTSLSSVVHNITDSANLLNSDLPDSLRACDGFIQPIFYKRFDCFSL